MRRLKWLVPVLLLSAGCVVDAGGAQDSGGDGDGGDGDSGEEGDEGTPDDPEPPDGDPVPQGEFYEGGEYWRVDLMGGEAEASVISVASVEIEPGNHEPVPLLDGAFMMVGKADGEVVGARAVSFVAGDRVELDLGDGAVDEAVVLFDEAPQTIFFPRASGADTLELVRGSDGAVVDTVDADELGDAEFAERSDNPITSAYPQIRLFSPGEKSMLPQAYLDGGYVDSIIEPSDAVYAAVLGELDKLPPALIASISGIALVEPKNKGCLPASSACGDGELKVHPFCAQEGLQQNDGEGQPTSTSLLNGAAVGSYLVLNVHAAPWKGTVAHEATHNFNNRIDARSNAGADQNWSPEAVNDAKEVVKKYSLGANLTSAWYELHNSVYEQGIGEVIESAPPGANWGQWCTLSDGEAIAGGFATPYGANMVADDIAEYASEVILDGGSAAVCAQFAGQAGKDDFPPELALAYTKLKLLHTLGVLTDGQFDACTDGIEIGRTTPGIELNEQVFTTELKAGYYDYEGTRYFAILGQGVEQWQLLYEAAVEPGQSPIGAHKFGTISGFTIPFGLPDNGAYLNHPDTPRASITGLLVISEVTEDRVEGAVFNLLLGNALNIPTSFDSYSPFLIEL